MLMNTDTLKITAHRWTDMISAVLKLKKIPLNQLQQLLKDTYKALYYYHECDLVPRELSKVLLEMEVFLDFSAMMENNETEENFYYYQAMYMVVKALEDGFFNGKYECAFPVLKLYDPMKNLHILDLENGSLEELM